MTIVQLPGFTYCTYAYNITPSMASYREIPRFILGSSLLLLAVLPTLKQSLDMYTSTKQWHLDVTMKLLVREGVLYFVVSVSVPCALSKEQVLTTGMQEPPLQHS